MDALPTYLAVIDSQDELFVSLHTRYLALAEERKKAASAAAAAAAAAAAGAAPLAAPSPLSLQALLQKQTELGRGVGKRACLEDTADPRLFKVPLIPTAKILAWEGGKGQAFAARLPDFSLDPRSGNNCLVARVEFVDVAGYAPRRYAAIELADAADSLAPLCHSCFRVDPANAVGGGGPGATQRKYVQGYKLGSWATRTWRLSGGPEDPFPRPEGLAFWWRLVVLPGGGGGGFAAFVDGRLVGWSAGPPGSAVGGGGTPPSLQVSLPASGEAGERVTMRVSQLWWGACELDVTAASEVAAAAAAAGATAPARPAGAAASQNLFATGVPDAATLPELLRAFEPHGAIDVSRAPGRAGAAIVAFADAGAAAAGLRSIAAAGGVRMHGAALAVTPGVSGK